MSGVAQAALGGGRSSLAGWGWPFTSWLLTSLFTCWACFVSADAAAEIPLSSTERSGSLSVAPSGQWRYPDDRPSWIDAAPTLSGEVHRWPVNASPSSTVEISRHALDVQLRAAAETYVEMLLDSAEAPAVIALQDAWIRARLAPARSYEGSVHAGDETLYEAAAELHFDAASRDEIRRLWQSHQVRHRMISLGAITFGGTLALLMLTATLSIVAHRAERRVESSGR